jgi:hypothetical protein
MVTAADGQSGKPVEGADELYKALVEVPEYALLPQFSTALRTSGISGDKYPAANLIHELADEGSGDKPITSSGLDDGTQALLTGKDVGAAFKNNIESLDLNHTYFCMSNSATGNCQAITGYGFVGSSTSGGVEIPNTRYKKNSKQKCLGNSRASNSLISVCGALSNLYGINGVCHQHTNRGQLSPHDTFINPSELKGGWASFIAYGAYGIGWLPCAAASQTSCFFSSIF